MDQAARVCPFCGEPPGTGVFCVACGRNLATVDQLPSRGEWEAEHDPPAVASERAADAVRAFVAAMHAAGDPGVRREPMRHPASFGRTRWVQGWVVRPVARDKEPDDVRRYEAGLFVSTDGTLHSLESEVRGWGQRNFPQFRDLVGEPLEGPPPDARAVPADLDAVLRAHGVGG